MGILRIDHPDIMEFIRAKEQEGEFVNFNLSVALTEKFMEAVEKGEDYDLIDPHSGAARGTLNAKEVFDILVNKAWISGDPGIVFLDRINRDNPTPQQGEMQSTNPCGEQPLLPYEACNLGSINLSKFVIPNKTSDNKEEAVDWDSLKEIIHLSVRFLDNVIDASKFPLEKIAEKVRTNRKIGLGVMGFADMLFALELPYNSEEALQLAEKNYGIYPNGRAQRFPTIGRGKRRVSGIFGIHIQRRQTSPQCNRNNHSPNRNAFHHRRLFFRGGTDFRPCFRPPCHGRRTACGSEPVF